MLARRQCDRTIHIQDVELKQIKDIALDPCDWNGMFRSICLLLVLLFSIAGTPRVHSMGADANLSAMVICSENGARTIYLDADGVPASPKSDCAKCPLCIALSIHALAAPGQSLPVRTARRFRMTRSSDAVIRTRRRLRPQSRGPPPTAPSSANPARANAALIDATIAAPDSTKVKSVASRMCHRFGRYLEDAQR